MPIAYLGLGSNLGDKEANLQQAIACLEQAGAIILAVSTFRVTKPYGVVDQPDFLNGVVAINWHKTPQKLLQTCLAVEKSMGRVRKRKWGERNIDIDVLLFGESIIHTSTLIVPHPDMLNRRFVLEPLNEIGSTVIHPVLHKTINELWQAFKKREGV